MIEGNYSLITVECLYDAPVSVMSGVLYRPLRSSDEGPRCLKVFGRPVDFLPMDVRDFCQPYCATCELLYVGLQGERPVNVEA